MREEPVEVVVIRTAKKDSAQVVEAQRKVSRPAGRPRYKCESPGLLVLTEKVGVEQASTTPGICTENKHEACVYNSTAPYIM